MWIVHTCHLAHDLGILNTTCSAISLQAMQSYTLQLDLQVPVLFRWCCSPHTICRCRELCHVVHNCKQCVKLHDGSTAARQNRVTAHKAPHQVEIEQSATSAGGSLAVDAELSPSFGEQDLRRTLLDRCPVLVHDVLEVHNFSCLRCLLQGLLKSISQHCRTKIAVLQIRQARNPPVSRR